jgi:hypothetical protein
MILHTNDRRFSHSHSSSWYNKPKNFTWSRKINSNCDLMVFTNLETVHGYPNVKKKYGWIIEPPSIEPYQYNFAKENLDNFTKIFTYDKNLLDLSEKFVFLPIGGCWLNDEEKKIYKKNKLVNIISSNKKLTRGHNLRHEIIDRVKTIDVFGGGYKYVEKKIDMLKDYMFSIVVENEKMDYLFTEKIIDCFLSGTIPIYYGCPSIGDFFDELGILTFDNLEELEQILSSLSEKFYYEKSEIIKKNFELAKKYTVADDLIFYEIYKK